jgi:hypothetical protein
MKVIYCHYLYGCQLLLQETVWLQNISRSAAYVISLYNYCLTASFWTLSIILCCLPFGIAILKTYFGSSSVKGPKKYEYNLYKYYVFGQYPFSCIYLKRRPVCLSKHKVSETGFYLLLQVRPDQLGPIDRASPHLREIGPKWVDLTWRQWYSRFRNVVFWKIDRTTF